MNSRIARETQRFQALRFKQLVNGLMSAGEKVERRDKAKQALREQIRRVNESAHKRDVQKQELQNEFQELDKKLGDHIDQELNTRLLKEEGLLGKLKNKISILENRVKSLESQLESEKKKNSKPDAQESNPKQKAKPKRVKKKKPTQPGKNSKLHKELLDKIKQLDNFIDTKEKEGLSGDKLNLLKGRLKELKKRMKSDKKNSKKK